MVNIAARVTAIAMGGQIITTKDTVDSLNPLFQSDCRVFDRISLKGKSEETIIYEDLWEKADDVTRMPTMIHFNNAFSSKQKSAILPGPLFSGLFFIKSQYDT